MFRPIAAILIGLVLLSAAGCQSAQTQAQPSSRQGRSGKGNKPDRPIAVQTAIAKSSTLNTPLQYTGTTAPGKLVSLRSQAEGRLLTLRVDVGDRVLQGQKIGELDDRLPQIAINQARAELASRQSEVDQAKSEVSDAEAQVIQTQVAWKQAQADANRLKNLAAKGAISQQQAEQAKTAADSAFQVMRSAQKRVRTRERSVQAAEGRVAAQFATVSEEQARRNYASLNAPISGVITERLTEPGNLIQPGNEILKIGNFNTLKIAVQVSELDLAKIQVGQSVKVKFDAFPKLDFQGRINRIAPTADATTRLIPVEVTVANVGDRITGGLLARVEFQNSNGPGIVIPTSALKPAGNRGGRSRKPGGKRPQASGQASGKPQAQTPRAPASDKNTPRVSGDQSRAPDKNTPRVSGGQVYVIEQTGEQQTVAVRSVTLGQTRNGQVEVLSGLQAGDNYVVRSDKPLKAGQSVRQSVLSESRPSEAPSE
ncbi:efflux RND transporter periplasmic adaptor subunit [filamentous cyanobacterium LEGE 11480]|uniref:Efflux RND transporter periplasmic adaptor subunit n=1 Tax=Romeriopsis navalis LEGE 11480 TaxID=2777977 RepID=A0A928Z4K1_9CYAN|nr:efflux RND transporter periplasmic adaptor subunit [Romeriopsis navalis]MBE9031112.1 efflux RND transporter periplasmic adaptor subunit [Romeriopsis navalis LEGE 11480]